MSLNTEIQSVIDTIFIENSFSIESIKASRNLFKRRDKKERIVLVTNLVERKLCVHTFDTFNGFINVEHKKITATIISSLHQF